MAKENVEIAKRAYAAFNRRDFDAALEGLDPDIEWHQITQFPDRAVYRGHEDMRDRFWNGQLVEQFGDFRIDVEEFVDAGDHVVMLGHLEMRDGKVIRAYDVAGPAVDATPSG